MVERKLEELSELTATPTSQLKFLPDAWAQVRGGLVQSPRGEIRRRAVACRVSRV